MAFGETKAGRPSERRRRAKSSREREFERLYLESYPIVYNYVRSRMSNDPESEDVVAEAYMLAARSFDVYDSTRSKFSTWVVRIAINCMNGYWRKHRPVAALDDVPENTFSVMGDESLIDDREVVDQLLEVLSDEERQLVVMKYREGKRNIDIAEELGMNASTVSTKLAKAIGRMRAAAAGAKLSSR